MVAHTYTHMGAHTHTHGGTYTYGSTYTCGGTYTHMVAQTYTNMVSHTHTHMIAYTYTHGGTYTHTYCGTNMTAYTCRTYIHTWHIHTALRRWGQKHQEFKVILHYIEFQASLNYTNSLSQ